MDALLRLRVLIWALVLGLWGIMVYQYLGEEEAELAQMQSVPNPYKGIPAARFEPESAPAPSQPIPVTATPAPPANLLARVPAAEPPPAAAVPPGSSLDFIKPIVVPRSPQRPAAPARRHAPMRQERPLRADPPIPPGFLKTATRHFNVYSEGAAPSPEFVRLLENLHGNLMLDLAAFSPWANDEKVAVFLFKSQDTYRSMTGRPAWSGGASSVPKRKVYVYESEELPGILAHELCHIYYDGFFLGGKSNPLWLSEGMATLVQIERGMAAPNWLRENMDIIEQGGGYPLTELVTVASTASAEDEKVRLWYAQSYSIVRFLIRSQYRSSFYKFSAYLREGKDVTQALYRAYGMPYNRLKALEYAWRYEIASNAPGRVSRAEPQPQ